MSAKTYTGGCHCGQVQFQAQLDLSQPVLACNCTICTKTGSLFSFIPGSAFTLVKGEEALRDYQFGKKHIHHMFCGTCGIRPFGRGATPDGGEMVAVNVRSLDEVTDVRSLETNWYDGRSL